MPKNKKQPTPPPTPEPDDRTEAEVYADLYRNDPEAAGKWVDTESGFRFDNEDGDGEESGEEDEEPTDNKFDKSQTRDRTGKWSKTGGGVSGKAELTPAPCCPSPMKPTPNQARVGVPADSVPPPGEIPRLPNLTKKQRAVETRFADTYTADPDKFTQKYLEKLKEGKVGVAPNVFATDDVKMLNRDWNPGKARAGEKLPPDSKKAMAKYNTAVHQTANAIAKRAFLQYLDDVVSKHPPGDPKRSVLVTNGGCAAGKGSTLARSVQPGDPHYGMLPAASQVGAVWDAAGEQNATENRWVYDECKKRGIHAKFAYVWADPKDTWDAPDRGVIRRAARKGRMVDARLFADSYAEGAKNMAAFVDSHRGKDGLSFVFIDNRKKADPKLLDDFPRETLKWDAEAIYADAVKSLKTRKQDLPKALYKGGLNGAQIWGPPAS